MRFCLIILCIHSSISYAQKHVWSFSLNGNGHQYVLDFCADSSQNIYAVGAFENSVDFDPGAGTNNIVANQKDGFVAKYDSLGNLIWAFGLGSISNESVTAVCYDPEGFIYVTGYIESTTDFDPGIGIANLQSGTQDRIFLAKYDLNGSYVWHIPIGDGNYDHPLDVAVDDSSNVAVTGWFQQTSDFDPGPGTALLTSPAGHSGFVAKFNNAGEYQWALGLGDNGGTIGMALTFGREGEIYATGEMSYTADFDPSSETFSVSANGSAFYVARYSSSGDFEWVRTVDCPGGIEPDEVIYDGLNRIITTGHFNNTADFDPGPNTVLESNLGQSDVFLQVLDSAGNYVWSNSFGGTGFEQGKSVSIDQYNNIYMCGTFTDSSSFDELGMDSLFSNGGLEIFTTKYNEDGHYLWGKSLGGIGQDVPFSIHHATNGTFYLGGYFESTVDFDPDTTQAVQIATSRSGFLAKYRPQFILSQFDTICSGVNHVFPDGFSSEISTVHQINFNSENGDSLVAYNLYVFTVDTSLIVTENSIYASSGEFWQWVECPSFQPIDGAVNQSFVPTENGSYAVIIEDQSCIDTSACVNISTLNIDKEEAEQLKIYPNPVKKTLNLPISSIPDNIQVFDMTGRKFAIESAIKQDVLEIEVSELAFGMYLLKIDGKSASFIKE